MPICAGLAQFGLDLGKATFDNAAASLGTLQGLLEDRLAEAVEETTWLPDPVRGLVREYIGLARRTRADISSTLDRSYELLRQLIGSEP
jgi:hypothetical protein